MKNLASALVRKFAVLSILCASLVYVSDVQATDHYTCCESDCEAACYSQYEECMSTCNGDSWCEYECQVNGTDCDQGCSMECDPSC